MKGHWWPLVVSGGIALVAIAAGLGWGHSSTAHEAKCEGPQTRVAAGFVELGAAGTSAASMLTALEVDDPLVISFGDADGIRSDVVVLSPVPPSAVLHRAKPPADVISEKIVFRAAIDGALKPPPGRASFQATPGNGFQVHARVTDGGDLVVCLQAERKHLIEARTYTGELRATAAGRVRAIVPVTIESRAPRQDAAIPAVVGFVAGLLLKLLAEAAAGGATKRRDAAKRYLGSWSLPLDVAFGAVAVGLLIRTVYFQDGTFGDTGDDSFVLAASAAAAQLGASGIVELGKRVTGGNG